MRFRSSTNIDLVAANYYNLSHVITHSRSIGITLYPGAKRFAKVLSSYGPGCFRAPDLSIVATTLPIQIVFFVYEVFSRGLVLPFHTFIPIAVVRTKMCCVPTLGCALASHRQTDERHEKSAW